MLRGLLHGAILATCLGIAWTMSRGWLVLVLAVCICLLGLSGMRRTHTTASVQRAASAHRSSGAQQSSSARGSSSAHPPASAQQPATAARLRAADAVTTLRLGLLVIVLAAALTHPGPSIGWTAVAVAIPMLALDLVDGIIARATAPTASGAAYDERVDATVVLVLSALLVPGYGAWTLLLGLAHFAFRLIGRLRPAWRAPLPPSWRRKTIAALQGPLLLAAGSPLGCALPVFGWVCALGALIGLAYSFGTDIIGAERRAREATGTSGTAP